MWSRLGLASGFLYQAIEKWAFCFGSETYPRKIFNSINIQCLLTDHVQQKIYFMGAYEPVETHIYKQLIQQDSVVFDLGANVGYYSLIAGNLLDAKGRVHSFEPIPHNFSMLKTNVESNSFAPRIKLNNSALWDENTTLDFQLPKGGLNNCGTYSAAMDHNSQGPVFKCPAMTLDSYCTKNNIEQLDLIKMDVEGAELHVLRGGIETLKQFQPLLLIEVRDDMFMRFDNTTDDFFKILAPLDYKAWVPNDLKGFGETVSSFSNIPMANVLFYPENKEIQFAQWNLKALKRSFRRQIA